MGPDFRSLASGTQGVKSEAFAFLGKGRPVGSSKNYGHSGDVGARKIGDADRRRRAETPRTGRFLGLKS